VGDAIGGGECHPPGLLRLRLRLLLLLCLIVHILIPLLIRVITCMIPLATVITRNTTHVSALLHPRLYQIAHPVVPKVNACKPKQLREHRALEAVTQLGDHFSAPILLPRLLKAF
jgi:hypothetical protein